MPGRQLLIDRPSRSREILPRRDRQLAWLYIALAYLLGALIVLAWTRLSGYGVRTEEDVSVVSIGLALVVLFVGLPAVIFLWKGVVRSGRAARRQGASTQHRLLILLTALFIVGALAGAVVVQSQLQRGRSRTLDRATPGMFDRSGLVLIYRGNQQYRNMNDRCSGNGAGPPAVIAPCGPENRPPCVTQRWLIGHNAWPLVQIGETQMPAVSAQRALRGGPRGANATSPILRPRSQNAPSILLVARGGCYLVYRRWIGGSR